MPVKWTPEKDQMLLLKILETHDFSVNTNAISAAWPKTDPNQIPAPRAIAERIVKIKALAKANGATVSTTVSTPKKRGAAACATTPHKQSKTSTPASGKRIQNVDDKANVKLELADLQSFDGYVDGPIKQEFGDQETMRTPSKRARTAPTAAPGMITYNEETDDENGQYTDTSEFAVDVNANDEEDEEEYAEQFA